MSFNYPPPRFTPPHVTSPHLTLVADVLPVGSDRRRPRLLLGAARHGLSLYRRDRDLPRLLSRHFGKAPLDALTEIEANIEQARRTGSATYSFARHIDILIALLAEQRLAPRA